ncbi:hypothetical protein HC251_23145 [Iamia sp. SCSIO 61187]|uniref:hypothetical protein n=1 Tax=Iamia sp. SCSIO 61187 TaxID=2722752 RepID=UPI001C63386B|nr:hypothetical protein [Iamia sp. SCSIO 61187]QYG95037.1 hypothetical protein HC251_23145 [Iamia sp. SCSIO 61187]
MAVATTPVEVDADVPVAALCGWCAETLTSPYLRRPDGTGLHVACARAYAEAQVAAPPA